MYEHLPDTNNEFIAFNAIYIFPHSTRVYRDYGATRKRRLGNTPSRRTKNDLKSKICFGKHRGKSHGARRRTRLSIRSGCRRLFGRLTPDASARPAAVRSVLYDTTTGDDNNDTIRYYARYIAFIIGPSPFTARQDRRPSRVAQSVRRRPVVVAAVAIITIILPSSLLLPFARERS